MRIISKTIIILAFLLNSCHENKNPFISDVINHCSIRGYIFEDKTNEPISGAKINIISQKEVTSDSTGHFFVDSIVCGQLDISVTKDFFEGEKIQLSIFKPDTISKTFYLKRSRIISYRVYSTIDKIYGNTGLNINLNDKIEGIFSYQIDSEDGNLDPETGYYYQYDKACIGEFKLNEIHFNNSINQDTLFLVGVNNDYENNFFFFFFDELFFGPFRDFQLRDSLGLRKLYLYVDFKDHSGKVFNDDKLPMKIEFEEFNDRTIFIAGIIDDNNNWSIYSEIDSLIYYSSNENK